MKCISNISRIIARSPIRETGIRNEQFTTQAYGKIYIFLILIHIFICYFSSLEDNIEESTVIRARGLPWQLY